MKIGLLHLTDIHFTKNTDLGSKTEKLAKVLINEFHNVDKIYLLISGDIAFSGKKEEYLKAKTFLSGIKLIVNNTYKNMEWLYILIPGNHDCDFSMGNDLRSLILKNMNYETIGKDNSIIDLSISVQKEFWTFYSSYHQLPSDKLFYQITDKIQDKTIGFTCINTAWMSNLHEEVGGIFFPVKRYESHINKLECDINIATWHHPINWFNPNTNENNKTEFQKFTESIAAIHFIGHEHEPSHYLNINKNEESETHIISGKLFNDDKKTLESGFKTIVIDVETKNTGIKNYEWSIDHFKETEFNEISLARGVSKMFNLDEVFKSELNDLKIPLIFDNKRDVSLHDIFVFPDMEISNRRSRTSRLESYIDSSFLMEESFKNCVIDGDSQIGKTTLLSFIFLKMYNKGYFPIILEGKDIKNVDLDKVVKKAFNQQYKNTHTEFDRFMQMDYGKRILLIDDYHNSSLNSSSTKELLEEASNKFCKILIVLDSASSVLPKIQADFQHWKLFNIKPLGYKKRNDLIEKYHYLKEDNLTIDEQRFLERIKNSFDNVQNVLGNKLMPSYPIFIISILQALEYKPMQQNETSYAYCYQTLIHYSLAKAGVANEDIDTYFNYLTELAYYFIKSDSEFIERRDYEDFYQNYKKQFIIQKYESVIGILLHSKIINEKDDIISFGYKYILYYLSAKKISDTLHKQEGQDIIKKLFDNVHEEKNASILVFVTHHSKDISFIEECLMNSMLILDKTPPITLETNDPFYDAIKDLAEDVKHDVLEINRNPIAERNKMLKANDESEIERERLEKEHEENGDATILEKTQEAILPFKQSFRTIEIVGQIIRNRKGSLPKKQLIDMITEIYTAGFRTVGFASEMLVNDKKSIINAIVEDTDESDTKIEVIERVNEFMQMMCLQTCLSVFIKLMHSVGSKDLKELYNKVASELNTPAAKLVSFTINTYYGSVSIAELKSIENDFKGNLVALSILRARVKSYVYNRNLDFKTKQQIASIFKMEISPQPKKN